MIPALPPQQIRRTFRAYLRSYLPSPSVPTSPIIRQELQPIVNVDDTRHLGAKIQPRMQWAFVLAAATGVFDASGVLIKPGRDGLYIFSIQPIVAATLTFVWSAGPGDPADWSDGAGGVGGSIVPGYNPANPTDPPQGTGIADEHFTRGSFGVGGVPGNSLQSVDVMASVLRHGPIYLPPDQTLAVVNQAVNTALSVSIASWDPTFATNARL